MTQSVTVPSGNTAKLAGAKVCMGVWNSMRHDARVARSAGTLARAGAQVTVVAASWDLEERGFARHELGFDIVTILRSSPWALQVGSRGVSAAGLAVRLIRSLPSQWRFMRELWRSRADIYHAHDLQALPWVWIVAKLRGRPLIYDAHEISTDRTAMQRVASLVRRTEGFLARHSDAMITTTAMRADHFVEQYGVVRPIVLQNRPHFVDVRKNDKLRETLGLPFDVPIVLYQGGMQRNRGLHGLLDQVPNVPKAHFVFLGNGLLVDELRARVQLDGLQERVHFMPAVPWRELPEWTASADIGVQLLENTGLNHYTTDSNKLFEYAMAGLPVVASDFPEIRRIVDEYAFGELVDPADADNVCEALRRLTEDPDLRLRYADNAWKARRQLSWETQEPELLRLYAQIRSRSVQGGG